jgi:hypothetical protein
MLRNKGLENYKDYLKLFDPPQPETNIPKLLIFKCEEDHHDGHPDCCPMMIEAIKACVYDKPRDNKPAEDVAAFDGDDPYDDLRYGVDSAERYFTDASKEFDKIQKTENLTRILKNNQDWTAFYRQMRSINAVPKMQTVKRFHHGSR